jgi:hypothetical protein
VALGIAALHPSGRKEPNGSPAADPVAAPTESASGRAASESVFAPLRQAALGVRIRAATAGVTARQLAGGDSLARQAEGLAAMGRQSAAMEHLAAATEQWETALKAVKPKRVAAPDLRQVARGTVTQLAQAVRARDADALRRIYPNMASDEHDKWVQFFQSTDSIIPSLRVESVEAQGARANVIIRGSYKVYPLNASQPKREIVDYRASFERAGAGGGWRLTMIKRGLFRK